MSGDKLGQPGDVDAGAGIETDIDAAEVLLMLAPETNGEVAVKSWQALSRTTGRAHDHLAIPKEDEKIRFRDVVAKYQTTRHAEEALERLLSQIVPLGRTESVSTPLARAFNRSRWVRAPRRGSRTCAS